MTIERIPVEQYRSVAHTLLTNRQVASDVIVLGSMQSESLVIPDPQVRILRRRGGGGAVYVESTSTLWIDLWIPTTDPCHRFDIRGAMELVGASFQAALARLGLTGTHIVAAKKPVVSSALCFAGVGPGEVLLGDRKVVGITAWRSREGSLFQTATYQSMPPRLSRWIVLDEMQPGEAIAPLDEFGLGVLSGHELAREVAQSLSDTGSPRPEVSSLPL